MVAPVGSVRRSPSPVGFGLLLALSACGSTEPVGGTPPPPAAPIEDGGVEAGPQPDAAPLARETYVGSVNPELATSCKACHATGTSEAPVFLAADPEASYARIVAWQSVYQRPEDSELLLHGEHAGPALTAEQAAKVTAWLELEFPAPEEPMPAEEDPPSALEALSEFSKCMSYDDWATTGMDLFPQTQTAFGPCQGCHEHGNGGTFLSDDAQETFERNRARPYVNKLVRPRYVGGVFAGLEANDRFVKKGITSCVEEDLCHPPYVLEIEQANSLGLFQAKSLARLVNGVCVTP